MFDKNTITITTKEYRELIAARHTLMIAHSLMHKECENSSSTYVDGKPYLNIMDLYFDAIEVENAGQSEDF